MRSPLPLPLLLLLLTTTLLAGCATTHSLKPPPPTPDPWESMNRTLFAFNSVVDSHLMQPVARGYKAVTPGFVDTGITNFFK